MASSEPVLEVERSESFTDDLLGGLWEMKSRGEMTDYNIKVNNDVIPCHSPVMAAASPYFQRLLHAPMKESENREVEFVLDVEYVAKVVEYCYIGKINIGLSKAEVCLDIAEYFQLYALKTMIEEFVCKQLSAEICVSWYFIADKFCLDSLKKQSRSMMISAFRDVVTHIEFHQLTLTELIDFIRQVVNVTDGDVVLDACVSWVTYNAEARSESFLDIVKHLRLDLCSKACMARVRKSWRPEWPNYADVQKVLDKKLLVLLLGGSTDAAALNTKIWKINLANGQCGQVGEMPHYATKYNAVYCATPRGLLVTGGSGKYNKIEPTTDCSSLSLPDMQWEQWPGAEHGVAQTAAVCIKNHTYIFGGDSTFKSVSCLDLNTKVWSSCPDMPMGNEYPIIAAIHEKVYMIFNTASSNDKFRKASSDVPMYCFDTSTHSWCELTPLQLPYSVSKTAFAKAVTVGEELFVVGGYKLCAKYSPVNETWTVLKPPGMVHCHTSAVYMEGKIILLGGVGEYGTCHKKIEVYDIEKNAWKVHQLRMPGALKYHYSAVYDETTSGVVM